MSWVSDYQYSWYETVAMNIIRAGGHIPRHIAFVMDGNRRYAKSERLQSIDGHCRGFEKLANCLRWCLDMGIQEVTTFAFSIENYKRSETEVNALLDLAREKFSKLLLEEQKLREHGVRIRVIGNIQLLPEDLQALISKAMLQTELNNNLFLNVAFSYTSRDEITQAVEAVLQHGGELEADDINERLLEECLYTKHSSPPELLFRTSGETRISDFMMWQLSTSLLYFTNILWPQLTLWNFLYGVFSYQRVFLRLAPIKEQKQLERAQLTKNSSFYLKRVQRFLQILDSYRKNILMRLSSTN